MSLCQRPWDNDVDSSKCVEALLLKLLRRTRTCPFVFVITSTISPVTNPDDRYFDSNQLIALMVKLRGGRKSLLRALQTMDIDVSPIASIFRRSFKGSPGRNAT